MKTKLISLALLSLFVSSSQAATFTMANLATGGVTAAQTSFRTISEDFGAAFSYKPITPAASLGLTGFDIGVELSGTDMSKSATVWQQLTGSAMSTTTLPVARLHATLGLPFGVDVGAFVTNIPTTNINVTGANISYAILEGDWVEPALTLRAAMTNLSGISEYSLSTKSVDISFSKGLFGVTPYIGAGQIWVNSSTSNSSLTAIGLQAENFTLPKVFFGLNVNLGLPNFAVEVDKTGDAQTISTKLGLRW